MNPPAETPNPDILCCIKLTNGADALNELYFKEGRRSVFTYKKTRAPLRLTLLVPLFCILYYFLSAASNQTSYIVTFTIANFIGVICLIWFLKNARAYFKWRKRVKEMITRVSSFKQVYLNIKASGFEAVYDDEVVIEKWSNFN